MTTDALRTGAWRAALEELGFRRGASGAEFGHNGLSVRLDRRWLTASAGGGGDGPPRGRLGGPGLWKAVGAGPAAAREFHLPLAALSAPAHDGDEEECGPAEVLESCLAWIEATAREDLPAGWQCPGREEVEAWIGPGALTVESKPWVAQGTLVCGGDRLALRVPLASDITPALSEARRAWIGAVAAEAQDLWRMVRMGLEGPPERASAVAEVDLSGAPWAVLERLFRFGLEGLQRTSGWILVTAGLLADARVDCRLWETGPERD